MREHAKPAPRGAPLVFSVCSVSLTPCLLFLSSFQVYQQQELATTGLPRKRAGFVRRGVMYLIRYFYLIVINAYLRDEVSKDFKKSFQTWLAERPELLRLIDNLQFPEER